jgi:hypothetical protein
MVQCRRETFASTYLVQCTIDKRGRSRMAAAVVALSVR